MKIPQVVLETKRGLVHGRTGSASATRASPAVSDGQVFIRTYGNLYRVGRR